jgi:hypothetical protein
LPQHGGNESALWLIPTYRPFIGGLFDSQSACFELFEPLSGGHVLRIFIIFAEIFHYNNSPASFDGLKT